MFKDHTAQGCWAITLELNPSSWERGDWHLGFEASDVPRASDVPYYKEHALNHSRIPN